MIRNEQAISPERLFRERGPFFHVCSKPVDVILFTDDLDRKTVLLYLALAAWESSVAILAYAIMSNHIHVLFAGNVPEQFYLNFIKRVNAYLARRGDRERRLPEEPTIVPVTSLIQFMNVTAYVIRNQYVVDQTANPVSLIWSSGYLYFNSVLRQLMGEVKYTSADTLSGRKLMKLSHSKELSQYIGKMMFLNDFPAPSSFVDYELVERLFSSARQFFSIVFRNVEGQVETALMLGENPVVPDEEMLRLMWKYCRNEWGVQGFRDLTAAQRIDLAKHMKYAYHSSNGQVARISGLTRKEIDTLFPQALSG